MAGLHAHNDQTQLRSDGGAQVHVAHGLIIDFDFELVQFVVSGNHLAGERTVALDQCRDGGADLPDGGLAHQNQVGAEGFELGVEKPFHGLKLGRIGAFDHGEGAQPKRPAT